MVGVIADAYAGSDIRGEWFPRPRRGSSASRALLARSGELAYSADAARKPAINRMKVTAHQRTSLGMAEIIGLHTSRLSGIRYSFSVAGAGCGSFG